MRVRQIARLGWIPDVPDHRDLLFAPRARLLPLPTSVDLRPSCPPVYDQGDLGSCTANAICAAYEFELIRQKCQVFMPSRLFLYYNERVIEDTVKQDSGAMLRDGMKTLAKEGVCPESKWPYKPRRLTCKPPNRCYTEALRHQSLAYHRISERLDDMKACLADGNPFVFGFTVFESFQSKEVAETGLVPMPVNEFDVGGHAVMCVGYDDETRAFIVRNSWGPDWGCKGNFFMPYDYLTNPGLADDRWVLTLVEG